MTQFIEGLDRQRTMLLPEHLDDYVDENSPAVTDMLDLAGLGFNVQLALDLAVVLGHEQLLLPGSGRLKEMSRE